jgi:TRAP-type transport system periplasmic protein
MDRPLIRRRNLVFGAFAVAAMSRLQGVRAQPHRLKFATLAPRGSAYFDELEAIGDALRKAVPQVAGFTIFPNGAQGGEADIVRRMRIGQLDGAMLSAVGLIEIEPRAAALQLIPMMFRSWDDVDAAGSRVRPQLERGFEDHGFIVLAWAEAGWVRFFSKQAALRPADFQRLRLFTWAGSPEQADLMKAAGYQPVVLETEDMLPGLQTGLIDAAAATPAWALASQIDSVAPHMLELRWAPIVGAIIMTRHAWEQLTPVGRDAIWDAAARSAQRLRARRASDDQAAIEMMKRRGLQVHVLSPELEDEWQRFAQAIYPRIRGKLVPADVFDAVQRSVELARAPDSAHAP